MILRQPFELLCPALVKDQIQVTFEGYVELVDARKPRIEVLHARAKHVLATQLDHLKGPSPSFTVRDGDTLAGHITIRIRWEVLDQGYLRSGVVLDLPPVLERLDYVVAGSFKGVWRHYQPQILGDDI